MDFRFGIWHAKMDFGCGNRISDLAFGMQKWILDLEIGSRIQHLACKYGFWIFTVLWYVTTELRH